MSPSSQQWTRRLRYSDQHIRVSDAERNEVAEILGQHYADGRLDQAEFDERVTRTMSAKTRGDLAGLFDDLPDTDSTAGAGSAAPGKPDGPAYPMRRGGRGIVRPLLLVLLVLVAANLAWHAFASLFFIGPIFWAVAVIAVIAVVTKSRRRDYR
jgi:hypothetical protein